MAKCFSRSLLVVAALLGGMAGALAQSGDQTPRAPLDQSNQATPTTPENSVRPDSGKNLTKELAHSDGVIAPPKTNDHAVKQPPDTGNASMPVVPPPGTPGGRQDVEPK